MMSSRYPLVSAVCLLLVFAAAALSRPSPLRNPSSLELISDPDQATPPHYQNLTFRKWPARPYFVRLATPPSGFVNLTVFDVQPFHGMRPVSIPGLQGFLREFRDNLEQKYPVPGYIPRKAEQSTYDPVSYTKWRITITEGYFGRRGRTEWALLALRELAAQLGDHGPAAVSFVVDGSDGRSIFGEFDIDVFGDTPLALSLANQTRTLQTG